MARTSTDGKLDARTARLKLAPRAEPYWRTIHEGRAIGYRRAPGGRGGTWIARHYDANAKPARVYHSLGSADDFMDADGADTLTFAQAQEKAREWFAGIAKAAGKVIAPLTVAKALENYLADYTARGGKALAETERAVNAHILPALGAKQVPHLSANAIRGWHRGLATAPARVRRKVKATKLATREVSADPDAQRARRATANRVLTVLKAALNLAFREGQVASDEAWRKVQPFPKVDAATVRHLSDDESKRLVNACDSDFRRLVTAALLTGCRYGELRSLQARDVNAKANVLTIRASKGGTARHVVLTDEARRFFVDLCAGKNSNDLLLLRDNGEAWGPSVQFRPMRAACNAAKIAPAVSFHILRHTHASRLASQGVPMAVIAAQLGHADLKMTSKHYAHLAPGYVSETIRVAFGSMGIVPTSNVATLNMAG